MAIIASCRPFTHHFIIQYCVEKANGKLRGGQLQARYSLCSKLYIVGRSYGFVHGVHEQHLIDTYLQYNLS